MDKQPPSPERRAAYLAVSDVIRRYPGDVERNAVIWRAVEVAIKAVEPKTGPIVQALDAIDVSDPERAHSEADDLVLKVAGAEVAAAYQRVRGRARWWAAA